MAPRLPEEILLRIVYYYVQQSMVHDAPKSVLKYAYKKAGAIYVPFYDSYEASELRSLVTAYPRFGLDILKLINSRCAQDTEFCEQQGKRIQDELLAKAERQQKSAGGFNTPLCVMMRREARDCVRPWVEARVAVVEKWGVRKRAVLDALRAAVGEDYSGKS